MVAPISHDGELLAFRSPVCFPLHEETKHTSAWPSTSALASCLHSCLVKSVQTMRSCPKVRIVLNTLKCIASAEEAELLLLLISLGTGFDHTGTVLLGKELRQTNHAQACSSSSMIIKKQKYSDFSFRVFPQLLYYKNCVSFYFLFFYFFLPSISEIL